MFQLLRGVALPAAACDGSRDGDSRYANLFRKLDLNEDGRVDIAELQTGLRAMGIPLGKEAEEVRAGRGRGGGPFPAFSRFPQALPPGGAAAGERPLSGTPRPWGGRGAARPPHPAGRPVRDEALPGRGSPCWPRRRGGATGAAAEPGAASGGFGPLLDEVGLGPAFLLPAAAVTAPGAVLYRHASGLL